MSTATAAPRFDPVDYLDGVQRTRYAALTAAREVLRNSRVGAQVFGGSKQEFDAVEAVDLIDVAEFILGNPDPLGESNKPWPTSPAQQTPWPYPHGPEQPTRSPWLPEGVTEVAQEASSPGTPPENSEPNAAKHGDPCPTCKATGTIVPIDGEEAVACPSCEGSGRWVDPF